MEFCYTINLLHLNRPSRSTKISQSTHILCIICYCWFGLISCFPMPCKYSRCMVFKGDERDGDWWVGYMYQFRKHNRIVKCSIHSPLLSLECFDVYDSIPLHNLSTFNLAIPPARTIKIGHNHRKREIGQKITN